MTIFRFTSADGLTNVEFTTDLIGYAAGSDNLTICQVVDNVGGTPNATTQALLNRFDRNKHQASTLIAYAATNSLSLGVVELGRETEAAGVVNANAPTLAAITSLAGTVDSATQVTLTWTKAVGATSYQLQRATNVGFTTGLVNVTLGDVATKVVTGLTTATAYWWRLVSIATGFTNSAVSTALTKTTS